jgi:hypothetical protein
MPKPVHRRHSQLFLLCRQQSKWHDLPASTQYTNSQLFMWFRTNLVGHILPGTCHQCHAQLFLQSGGYAQWLDLYTTVNVYSGNG